MVAARAIKKVRRMCWGYMNDGGVRVIARLLIYETLVERGLYGLSGEIGVSETLESGFSIMFLYEASTLTHSLASASPHDWR